MKKLILTSSALLAFAAASYAQVNQVGLQQSAEQIRVGTQQTGTINQDGGTQVGGSGNYGNYAITIQGVQSNTGPANADINQNDGSQGNRAGITQNGGTGVNAEINQNGGPDGLSGGGVSSTATIGAAAGDGNFAGIAQNGTELDATINQNNNSRRNGAEIYQNGSFLSAEVNQNNGSINNDALILQGYSGQNQQGLAITDSEAIINQGRPDTGATNDGTIVGEAVSSTARIYQNASLTFARIDQGTTGIGSSEVAANGRSDGSVATIDQQAGAQSSTALIEQGVNNGESFGSQATITQTKANNFALIQQGGGTDITTNDGILLGGSVGGSDQGSRAIINQTAPGTGSAENTASIAQGAGGNSLENIAQIDQNEGVVGGNADIIQAFGAGSYSANNEARITQASVATSSGSGNIGATIYQAAILGDGGTATGSLNLGVINQGAQATDTFGEIYQGVSFGGGNVTASRNVATINQTGGSRIEAIIVQGTDLFTGTDIQGNEIVAGNLAYNNNATINQTGGTDHEASISQNGRFNTALINQSGAASNINDATIIQSGGSNRAYAEIVQSAGSDNTATIIQLSGSDTDNSGVGNYARVEQRVGANNTAFIQQGGAALGAATFTGSSNDNYFDLIQNGSNNQVNFLQTGNNNRATIRQNGNNNQVLANDGTSIASQQGYNNVLELTQNGGTTGVTFFNTQIGNNLTAKQTQTVN